MTTPSQCTCASCASCSERTSPIATVPRATATDLRHLSHRFGPFGSACVELAFHEQRYSPAASLLGYARKSWGSQDTQRRCAELLAELQAVPHAEMLERLLAEGEALDEKRCVR